jgi:putative peptidoglycan lipid II flippase
LVLNAYPVIPRLLIERPLLGALGDGTLATLDFAEKTTVILGLAGYAIVGVATASLSGATSSYRRRAAIVALLLTPAAIAMGVFAAPIVSLLFERGAFSASDSAAVTELTRLLAPSIPFVAALPLLVPGVQERGALRQGAALVAIGLLAHTLVTAYTCRTGDARPLAITFDAVYLLLFAGFYALAGGARRPQLGGDAIFGGVPRPHG